MSTSHEGVEVAPDGLQFLSDGLEPLDDFDVTVDFAVFVSFDHVARSLQGHASLFHEVIDQSHLFYVSFGVLSDASACLLWLDVGEFFFPVAQQGFAPATKASKGPLQPRINSDGSITPTLLTEKTGLL